MNTKELLINHLIDEHGHALVRFLTRKLKNQEDAADIAQDAYLKIYSLKNPETINNAKAFLFQTASNMATDQLRRKALYLRYLQKETNQHLGNEPSESEQTSPSAEQTIQAEQQLQQIYHAITELSEKCRQAFLLQRNQGMTYTEIANQMNVSVSSVEKYISQALKHFHRTL